MPCNCKYPGDPSRTFFSCHCARRTEAKIFYPPIPPPPILPQTYPLPPTPYPPFLARVPHLDLSKLSGPKDLRPHIVSHDLCTLTIILVYFTFTSTKASPGAHHTRLGSFTHFRLWGHLSSSYERWTALSFAFLHHFISLLHIRFGHHPLFPTLDTGRY